MDRPLIALVVALAHERRALQRSVESSQRVRRDEFRVVTGGIAGQAVALVQAGIGRGRARRALLAVSRRFPLRAAWSLGFAGGLAAGVQPGALVCPRTVLQDDGGTGRPSSASAGHAAVCTALDAAGLPPHVGPLLTVDAPLRTPPGKRAAHQRTGAIAVDMEAAGMAEAANRLGIPWLALKAVVDGVEDPLPEFLAGCTTARGDLRWPTLLCAFLAGGEQRRTLRRLARVSRPAGSALRRAVAVALEAWCR